MYLTFTQHRNHIGLVYFLIIYFISKGEAIYASTGKSVPMSNSTLLRTSGRSARHSRGGGGMTSSSSASSNSNNNLERYRESRENRDQKDKDDIKDSHRPTRLLLQNGKWRC